MFFKQRLLLKNERRCRDAVAKNRANTSGANTSGIAIIIGESNYEDIYILPYNNTR